MSDSSPLAYLHERTCELDIGAFLHHKDSRFALCTWPMVLRKLGIGENENVKADSITQRCFLQVLLESPRCDFV